MLITWSRKACALAKQDGAQTDISDRIRGTFFLATPHRGSNYADILNKILKLSEVTGFKPTRDYVEDLTAGSLSTQLINQEFAKCADHLIIYSFYETLEVSVGVTSCIIVDKISAILGTSRNSISIVEWRYQLVQMR
jgi:hypothetical protein